MKAIDYKNLAIQALKMATLVRRRQPAPIPGDAPVDPVEIARNSGCMVTFKSLPSLEGLYVRRTPGLILVGSQRPAGRRSFTIAHELGHHLFGHGTSLDELTAQSVTGKNVEDQLVDRFAGYVLMSRDAVRRALFVRGFQPNTLTPSQAFLLASQFGVGYSAFLGHVLFSLREISEATHARLSAVGVSEIKKNYGVGPSANLVIADKKWTGRSIDLEIGDCLVAPVGVIEDGKSLVPGAENDCYQKFIAKKPGVTRVVDKHDDWSSYVRISQRWYEGHAEYRFLDVPEEEA